MAKKKKTKLITKKSKITPLDTEYEGSCDACGRGFYMGFTHVCGEDPEPIDENAITKNRVQRILAGIRPIRWP